jgi:hypothetical protein
MRSRVEQFGEGGLMAGASFIKPSENEKPDWLLLVLEWAMVILILGVAR